MTQGISQSLNLALARVNYIEHSFSALENIAGQIPVQTNTIESDFKKILDKKIEQTTTIEKTASPEEKPEIAKDVDIFVKPDKAWFEVDNPACNGFMMLAGKFKSNLDGRLQMAKMFFLPYKPNNGYAWVSLKDMSVVGENLVAKANKIITEV